jgi:hypothetical protein
MNLIRTACKAILFVTGLVVFYVGVVFALSSIHLKGLTVLQKLTGNMVTVGGWGQSLLRFRELEHIHDLDILFIGSSHSYRGFDPRLFRAKGYSSFNMGSTAQTPMNTYFLLKRYLAKIKPKVIIAELYPEVFAADGYESTLDLLANLPFSWELLEMSLATGNPHAVTNSLGKLIREHKYPLEKFNQVKIDNETYISSGYVETSMARKEELGGKKHKIKILDSQFRYFSKSMKLAKKFNITVVGVIQPLPDDYLRSTSNYKAVINDLRHIANKYKVVILDFNDMMTLDPVLDYKDKGHLNKSGVLKFNKILLNKLLALKLIPENTIVPS